MLPFQVNTDLQVQSKRNKIKPNRLYYLSTEWPDLEARNYVLFLQLLFCNQFFELEELINVNSFPLHVPGSGSEVTLYPFRYSHFFSKLIPLTKWVEFLINTCHMQPHVISIDLSQLSFNDATMMDGSANALFRQFFSCAVTLKISLFMEPKASNLYMHQKQKLKAAERVIWPDAEYAYIDILQPPKKNCHSSANRSCM